MEQFYNNKEELIKFGEGFYSQAFNLIDDFYNLTFWLLLNERSARKVVFSAYERAINYCDKTKGSADWHLWLHRILINLLVNSSNYLPDKTKNNFEWIDQWNIQPDSVDKIITGFSTTTEGKRVVNLLNQIPGLFLLPLILKSVYKLSSDKAAKLLDVPSSVIALRLYRARKMLFILISESKSGKSEKFNGTKNNHHKLRVSETRELALFIDDNLSESKKAEMSEKLNKSPQLKTELKLQGQIDLLVKDMIKRKYAPRSLKRKIENLSEKRFFSYADQDRRVGRP